MRPFWNMFDTTIITMACLRFISGFIELTAAVLILFGNDVKKALFINSLLALIGPLVMLASIYRSWSSIYFYWHLQIAFWH
jgi:hypothetical protein